MKYAIIRLGGSQYKVEEGQELLVNKLNTKDVSSEVLLVKNDKDLDLGTPTLKESRVKLSLVSELEKGDKLYVSKYKAKSRYRKRVGFRHEYSRVKVDSIA